MLLEHLILVFINAATAHTHTLKTVTDNLKVPEATDFIIWRVQPIHNVGNLV